MTIILGISPVINAAKISIEEPNINPKQLERVENNGKGTVSFNIREISDSDAPVLDIIHNIANITIYVDFKKIKLTDDDITKITGNLVDYFDIRYHNQKNRLIMMTIMMLCYYLVIL